MDLDFVVAVVVANVLVVEDALPAAQAVDKVMT